MVTEEITFVDTDILIGVSRRVPRALDFWRRAEERSAITCSVISVFELLGGCRNAQEQREVLRDLTRVNITHVESGDSTDALTWYQDFHLS